MYQKAAGTKGFLLLLYIARSAEIYAELVALSGLYTHDAEHVPTLQ